MLAMVARRAVLVWRCWKCERVIGEYLLPAAYHRRRCERCGSWNEIVDGEQRPAA